MMETPFVPCSGERVPPTVKVALPWASRCAYRASCSSVPREPASLPDCNLHMKASYIDVSASGQATSRQLTQPVSGGRPASWRRSCFA